MRNTAYLPEGVRRARYPDAGHQESTGHPRLVRRDLLWIPALLIFGLGDILTTQLALSLGAEEHNALVSFLIDSSWGLWAFCIVKAAILIPLALVSLSLQVKHRWIVPGFLCGVGLCLLGGNISVILSLI
jgi:hypothetical protein